MGCPIFGGRWKEMKRDMAWGGHENVHLTGDILNGCSIATDDACCCDAQNAVSQYSEHVKHF